MTGGFVFPNVSMTKRGVRWLGPIGYTLLIPELEVQLLCFATRSKIAGEEKRHKPAPKSTFGYHPELLGIGLGGSSPKTCVINDSLFLTATSSSILQLFRRLIVKGLVVFFLSWRVDLLRFMMN